MSTEVQHQLNKTRTKIAVVLVTVAFTLFYGLMPIILGNAADSLSLTERQIGFLASFFMSGQTLGFFSGVFWVRRYDWRVLIMGAGVVMVLGFFFASESTDYVLLSLSFSIAGIASAVGYGVTIACLGDTDEPDRWYAWAWFAQAVVGSALAYFLPRLSFVGQDFHASMLFLIGVIIVLMPLVILMPSRGVKDGRTKNDAGQRLHAPFGALLAGLLVIILVFVAESGLWAFLDRIAVAGGFDRKFAGNAIAASFIGAACGSFVAGIIGTRFGRLIPMGISIFASIGAAILFYVSRSPMSFLVAAVVYGLAWNLGAPYRMALVADADTSGRYSTLIPGMQAIGSVIGPGMAGLLVIGGSFAYVYVMSSIAWLVALVLFVWANKSLSAFQTASEVPSRTTGRL